MPKLQPDAEKVYVTIVKEFPMAVLDTPTQTAADVPPTSADLQGRFVAVEMLDTRYTGAPEIPEHVEWVIVETPSRYSKSDAISYACTRAIATDPKYQEWKLGSTYWVENGLRLVPEQDHGLFD